jgi:hypothetical protein
MWHDEAKYRADVSMRLHLIYGVGCGGWGRSHAQGDRVLERVRASTACVRATNAPNASRAKDNKGPQYYTGVQRGRSQMRSALQSQMMVAWRIGATVRLGPQNHRDRRRGSSFGTLPMTSHSGENRVRVDFSALRFSGFDPKPSCCMIATGVAIMHIIEGAGDGMAPFFLAPSECKQCRSRLG